MSVITISRGSYSRGKVVAEALAKELDYECISRDIIVESSNQFNIPEIKLIKALHDAPSVLERFSHGQERYISFFKASFLSHLAQGNIVYHGLAGHFFLQDISHVLKVRINAKMLDRIDEEVKRENCTVEEARYNLKKDDQERRKWGLHLYGKDTWDSRLYDMVFCIDALSVTDVVDILAAAARKKQFQETEQSRKELQNRLLVANIQARLLSSSTYAQVTLQNDTDIELSNIEGRLLSSKTEREEFSLRIKDDFGINDVVYKESLHPYKGHVNTFYNIDVQ